MRTLCFALQILLVLLTAVLVENPGAKTISRYTCKALVHEKRCTSSETRHKLDELFFTIQKLIFTLLFVLCYYLPI